MDEHIEKLLHLRYSAGAGSSSSLILKNAETGPERIDNRYGLLYYIDSKRQVNNKTNARKGGYKSA